MKITRKKGKEITTFSFEGDLTIYHVAESKADLFADHEQLGGKIALDLHKVSEIDTAGVQLLLFARLFFASADKSVFITKSNELVDAVLEQLDLLAQFSLASK